MFDETIDKVFKEYDVKNKMVKPTGADIKPVVESQNDIRIKKFHKGTELFDSL